MIFDTIEKEVIRRKSMYILIVDDDVQVLSALKIILKDADGNLLRDIPISLVEQLKDAEGNYAVGKVLKTKNTKKRSSLPLGHITRHSAR